MADYVGQDLGNYHLVRLLGKGGFAQVYLGKHRRLETQAAIKVLSTSLTEADVNHFLIEARTIARLEHPHIIRILDFDVEEGIPFFAMSYAPNGTLRQRYPRGTCLPLETILTYIKQAADALQYAHDLKLIHRDIKPENMLLGQRDELLLSDFGVAVIAHSSRSQNTQEIIGTVSYMAPEQIQGKPRTASDQYALGVVVYEWLCGSSPFQGTSTEVATQHLHATPPPLHEKIPTIPLAIESVVLKALEKDYHQRFASIQEFATAFEQSCEGHLQSAPIILSSHLSRQSLPNQLTEQVSPSLAFTQPKDKPYPPKRNIRRRALLLRALGFAGSAVGGAGIAWLALSRRPQASSQRPQLESQQPQEGNAILTYTGHTRPVKAVAWSPNSERIASAGDEQTVQVWNASTGDHIWIYRGHTTNINALAWSPKSQRIASASGNSFFGGEHVVQVWDPAGDHFSSSYGGHSKPVRAVIWSPNGTRIASGSEDNTVQVWDATNGNRLLYYNRHTGPVYALAWSPDGTLIASASDDKTVQIWSAQTAAYSISLNHTNPVITVAWSPNGKYIASASGNTFLRQEHTVEVWNAGTGEHLLTYNDHTATVNAVAWSPDSKYITSGSDDKMVQIWDATVGTTLFTYSGHTLGVTAIAWSANGQFIASASNDGTVRVWRVST
jgi:eukaryotic-like serine/threonine-protein kinase